MSDRPRDDDASYMPVFKVGSAHGRTLASALKIPLYSFSHQRGHVAAARHGSGLMQHSFLVLQLSGGTTELLRSDHQTLSLLGATKDINAGQLIDRVGVRLGYGFPCGMEMEKLAISGTSASLLPSAMDNGGLDCHFSGAETQAARWIEQGKPPKDIACEIFNFIARVSAKMITAAYQQTGVKDVLLTGGVSSSALIRYMLALRMRKVSPVRLYWGQPELSSDNAVGIALLAAESYILKE
jgi:N6-L-threonylcarbamoyladenine synthase